MPMQRARRLASVAVVASVAVAGLSACRSEPSVAAYVGSTKITDSAVQAVLTDAKTKLTAAGAASTAPIKTTDVVSALLSARVLAEVAKQQSLSLPADLGLGEYASSLQLPADSQYVRLFAEADSYVKLLRQGVKTAPELTDADLREVYDVLAGAGQVGTTTFDQFKTQLPAQNKQLVQTAIVVRKEISDTADKMDIRVNPKYQPVGVPVLQFQTNEREVRPLISAPLGSDDTSPVTDLR
jgi:parvulin-like peptidyl-prolyl isomerase